jgi:hypothetical protein
MAGGELDVASASVHEWTPVRRLSLSEFALCRNRAGMFFLHFLFVHFLVVEVAPIRGRKSAK